jgi:hypothetical protein
VLEKLRDKAKDTARERLRAGDVIPGWKLTNQRGPQFISHEDLEPLIARLGLSSVLATYGNLSALKFRELWESTTDAPFPEELIKHGPATVALRAASTQLSTKTQTK